MRRRLRRTHDLAQVAHHQHEPEQRALLVAQRCGGERHGQASCRRFELELHLAELVSRRSSAMLRKERLDRAVDQLGDGQLEQRGEARVGDADAALGCRERHALRHRFEDLSGEGLRREQRETEAVHAPGDQRAEHRKRRDTEARQRNAEQGKQAVGRRADQQRDADAGTEPGRLLRLGGRRAAPEVVQRREDSGRRGQHRERVPEPIGRSGEIGVAPGHVRHSLADPRATRGQGFRPFHQQEERRARVPERQEPAQRVRAALLGREEQVHAHGPGGDPARCRDAQQEERGHRVGRERPERFADAPPTRAEQQRRRAPMRRRVPVARQDQDAEHQASECGNQRQEEVGIHVAARSARGIDLPKAAT